MTWQKALRSPGDLDDTFTVPAHYASGFAIGVIAVDLRYPKLPGNVANATTFAFPVLYERVDFPIEQLFAGDSAIKGPVVEAARRLEAQGVRAIVGACGFFAHFQDDVAQAVEVPVFLSSMLQLPLVERSLPARRRVLVLTADAASVDDAFISHMGGTPDRCLVCNVGDRESFAAIRWGDTTLDNGRLAADLQSLAARACADHPEVGAILLECSDLPPYAAAIQAATGRPVFDFITLINWVHAAVVQTPYYGYF